MPNVINGSPLPDDIFGTAADDLIGAGDGNDTVHAGDNPGPGFAFPDRVFGGNGDDVLYGEGGNDILNGEADNDQLYGGDGQDALMGGDGNDLLDGGDGPDGLTGGAGNDTLLGGLFQDQLNGGSGVDVYDGGDGRDRVNFFDREATQGAWADLRTNTVYNDGFGNTETLVSIEGLGGGTQFVDRLYGNNDDNIIGVGLGDIGYGFGGNDIFVLSGMPATADGGKGIDTLAVVGDPQLVADGPDADSFADQLPQPTHGAIVSLESETVYDDGYGNSGTFKGFENLIGSRFDDVLEGDKGDNRIQGGFGDDQIDGGKGDDFLMGELGDDIVAGGKGKDTFAYFLAAVGPTNNDHDQVLDFEVKKDTLLFFNLVAADLTVADTAQGALISWNGAQQSVLLVGVAASKLDADNFAFDVATPAP